MSRIESFLSTFNETPVGEVLLQELCLDELIRSKSLQNHLNTVRAKDTEGE